MIKVGIVSLGNEILSGKTVDTNCAFEHRIAFNWSAVVSSYVPYHLLFIDNFL